MTRFTAPSIRDKIGRQFGAGIMPYTLQDYCAELTATIKAQGVDGLPALAEKLALLLKNPAFVAAAFSEDDPPGRRELWHDAETDIYVLAHVQEPKKIGTPHSHGASWAIYGTARGYTDMTEWRRVNGDGDGDEGAVLEKADAYRLAAGETRAYGPGVIHATAHPEKAWVVRVTGTDLDAIPRFRFKPGKDRILERA
jgi:hypothetical protein